MITFTEKKEVTFQTTLETEAAPESFEGEHDVRHVRESQADCAEGTIQIFVLIVNSVEQRFSASLGSENSSLGV